jgi:uncharacterized protein YbjT (DUF2867 family)
MRSLVLGATGYVGRLLVPLLLDQGHEVRALVRDPGKADWRGMVEVVPGDVLQEHDVARALTGVDVVFYLVHSLGCPDFAERDRAAARITATAAELAGVQRIVYLGGIRPRGNAVSSHLHSRAEVGDTFLRGTIPAVLLQASIVVGAGSVSYEILRAFARTIPVVLTAGVAARLVQPIAIGDVLHYLVAAGNLGPGADHVVDIGGPDRMTYSELLQRCARLIGGMHKIQLPFELRRTGLPAALASMLCPVSSSMARALFQSLRNDTVCSSPNGPGCLPDPPGGRTTFDSAVLLAERMRGTAVVPPESDGGAQSWRSLSSSG